MICYLGGALCQFWISSFPSFALNDLSELLTFVSSLFLICPLCWQVTGAVDDLPLTSGWLFG